MKMKVKRKQAVMLGLMRGICRVACNHYADRQTIRRW